jgi:hypothetical protein
MMGMGMGTEIQMQNRPCGVVLFQWRIEESKRQRDAQRDEEEKKQVEKHPLDAIVKMAELEKKRKANPSLTWKGKDVEDKDFTGKQSNLYYKRQKRYREETTTAHRQFGKIPSLFDLCVNFLVENFDNVESLGAGIDSSIRRKICEQLVATGRMNGAAFDTLAEVGTETLEITDCVEVSQEQLVEALDQLMPAGLRALLLTNCGRCFGAKAVEAITKSKVNDLFALSITGAYALKDIDASRLIESAAETLSSIEFKACPMIGTAFCNTISTHFSSKSVSQTPLLELSLHDVQMTKENLMSLAKSDALRNLKSISLNGIDSLDDHSLGAILDAIDGNASGIDLSNCVNLTDESLSNIRRCNKEGKLQALQLSGIKNFTASGLEAFFTSDIPDLAPPPILRILNLSGLDFEAVTENVIDLAINVSASQKGDSNDLAALGGFVTLNVR